MTIMQVFGTYCNHLGFHVDMAARLKDIHIVNTKKMHKK
jgi:hypothetical protein